MAVLVMMVQFGKNHRRLVVIYILAFCNIAYAEGVITFKPYVSSNISYDDNIFRFSSPDQAQAAFGNKETSDFIKRFEFGAELNVNLSRQLFTLSSGINENIYDRFSNLDYTGKSNRITWNWLLGSDFYGELTASQSSSIAGFNELRNTTKNLRTTTNKLASANWKIHPEWTVFVSGSQSDIDSDQSTFRGTESTTNAYQAGMRYLRDNGSGLTFAYSLSETDFPSNTNFIFGDSTQQKSFQVNASWVPTLKTRLSVSLSTIDVGYERFSQRDVSGINQRMNLSYALTGKTSLNISAYQEISAINDIVSTFVKSKGITIRPVWSISSKTSLSASLGYEKQNYLGDAGFFNITTEARKDDSTTASLAFTYLPTDKSVFQLQYQGENRLSNINTAGYQFNNLSAFFRYNF